MSVIEARGLFLNAHIGQSRIEVLRNIDFAIPIGSTLGVVGESGAGKSMIGRLISGLLPERFSIAAGELLFKGDDMARMSKRQRRGLLGRRIAFIPQEPLSALNPVRSIGDQFNEHLRHLGIARAQRHPLAIAQLQSVQLQDPQAMLRRFPHELSGGQCQRVLIAMAFSGEPDLVVADEPTTALDVMTQAQIMRVIAQKQAAHGTAMLFITHDLRLAAQVCERVAVMYAGDMVECGPAGDVLRAPSHPYTKSLLASIPRMSGERVRLPALDDHMPGLLSFAGIAGCRFASRCRVRDGSCESRLVSPMPVGPGHWARCTSSCAALDVADSTNALAPPLVHGPGAAPILTLVDVQLRHKGTGGLFGRRRTHFDAVKKASFEVMPGEIVGIVGESGSGKSSIGRLIVGLERATAGVIRVNGHEPVIGAVAGVSRHWRDAQMIFQDSDSALNPRRSVERLLAQALEVQAGQAPSRASHARETAQKVRLPADCLARFPGQLSGGQKQRVNIGRALGAAPKLIVADEIVSGLDVSVQAHVLNLLIDLNRRDGLTIVFISHDLAVVRYLCSRVFLMQGGEIVEQGPTDEVFSNPKHFYTRRLIEAIPPEPALQGLSAPSMAVSG